MGTPANKLLSKFKPTAKYRSPTEKAKIVHYSDRYKVMYYSIPKVACTTIKTCLAKLENIDIKGLGVHTKNNAMKRLTMKESNIEQYKDYYRFSFVRDPWDRLFSCYKNKIYDPPRFFPKSNPYYNEKGEFKDFIKRYGDLNFKDMQFEDFVDFVVQVPDHLCDPHFLPQHYYLEMERINFLGQFENFQSDMFKVLKKISVDLDLSDIISEKKQSSSPGSYKDAYKDRTRALVAEKYAKDIELFNYTWD